MLKALLISAIFPSLLASDMDPNGFFKDRSWKVTVNKSLKILAQAQYLGEPVQRPSKVTAKLMCGKNKSLEVFSERFCGINYMKVVGGKLEVFYLDYDSTDPRGYCRKKRIQRYNIPSCNKKK